MRHKPEQVIEPSPGQGGRGPHKTRKPGAVVLRLLLVQPAPTRGLDTYVGFTSALLTCGGSAAREEAQPEGIGRLEQAEESSCPGRRRQPRGFWQKVVTASELKGDARGQEPQEGSGVGV